MSARQRSHSTSPHRNRSPGRRDGGVQDTAARATATASTGDVARSQSSRNALVREDPLFRSRLIQHQQRAATVAGFHRSSGPAPQKLTELAAIDKPLVQTNKDPRPDALLQSVRGGFHLALDVISSSASATATSALTAPAPPPPSTAASLSTGGGADTTSVRGSMSRAGAVPSTWRETQPSSRSTGFVPRLSLPSRAATTRPPSRPYHSTARPNTAQSGLIDDTVYPEYQGLLGCDLCYVALSIWLWSDQTEGRWVQTARGVHVSTRQVPLPPQQRPLTVRSLTGAVRRHFFCCDCSTDRVAAVYRVVNAFASATIAIRARRSPGAPVRFLFRITSGCFKCVCL